MTDIHPTDRTRINLSIDGRKTSLALEKGVWDTLTEICRREETDLDGLLERIIAAADDDDVSMASAIRMHVLGYFMERYATE
jgi:predicted DNA-binding ribbon-helix-helix protein